MNKEIKNIFIFNNSYVKLPKGFYYKVLPEPVRCPKIIKINDNLAYELGINSKYLYSEKGMKILAGNFVPEDSDPIAMAYAGHQFGSWVPKLGDGRAILLGEVISKKGIRYDIQLKGSGKTPFSRNGDGRAWVGPVIREYLASEAMASLNIPTTRSLAAILTGEEVYRETSYPGSILTRVSKSHIRVGTFQYFCSRRDYDAVRNLSNYTIDRIYPEIQKSKSKHLDLLRKVIKGQAELIAKWMGVGFIHGVMNTDNCSISCETIDYGPCAFLDNYSSNQVFSSIDHTGRYSYANQPEIGMWNIACLATALLPIINDNEKKAIKDVTGFIEEYPELYKKNWLQVFRKKLGLTDKDNNDINLINDLLVLMEKNQLDFTITFRNLSNEILKNNEVFSNSNKNLYEWKKRWKKRLSKESLNFADIGKKMCKVNPIYILRNHRVEEAINKILVDDYSTLNDLITVISSPFEYNKKLAHLEKTPLPEERVLETYCGT